MRSGGGWLAFDTEQVISHNRSRFITMLTWDDWITGLVAAREVEPAAEITIREALRCALSALPEGAELRRGLVHSRPDGSYRGLLVLEAGQDKVRPPRDLRALLPSLTAWRAVEESGLPVAVDVTTGAFTHLEDDGKEVLVETRIDEGQSRVRLLSRDATHVLVLPLRSGSGVVGGMLSLEAKYPEGIGAPSPWSGAVEALRRICALAGPFLLALPAAPREDAEAVDPFLPVIGEALGQILAVLGVFARHDETLLIRGPTGAGKSRLARWCHERSRRKRGPYEVVDLLAIPEHTQMGELFGWRRGAFTGATKDHDGFVARAAGGTLFIDEIDKLSMTAQAGLLTLLEERTYRPLGHSGTPTDADVRFVVGSNADLEQAVREGRFREDLFYRIDVLPVRLPGLVSRRDEIPAWANHMLQRRHRESAPNGHAAFEPNAIAQLSVADWPGNLRQLDNVVRRAYLYALVGFDDPPQDIVVGGTQVTHALGPEPEMAGQGGLTAACRRAATAFLGYAQARAESGETLDLDLTGSLAGFVLERGLAAGVEREALFEMLGREQLVKGRNHHRVLRREAMRVRTLLEVVEEDPDEAMSAFFES